MVWIWYGNGMEIAEMMARKLDAELCFGATENMKNV